MERAEKYGIGIAAAGHVLLFGLLSVGFLATPNPLKLESKPIDISLVDEVSLESAAPTTTEAPATSQAPDVGDPEDSAPAPAPESAEPQPATPPPAPPQPKPEPARPAPPQPAPPVAKPAPAKPAPTKPAPVSKPAPQPRAQPAPAKPQPARPATAQPAPAKSQPSRPVPAQASRARAGLSRPDVTPERAGTSPAAKASRPRGSVLGDDFRKSLAISADRGTGEAPRAAKVSAQAVAGLGDAIARQVQPCANRIPNPGPGANQIRSKLRIRMNADGSLAGRPTVTGQTGVDDENGRYAQRVGELAAAAVIQCAPYKLPAELYENGWKDIIINYRLPG